MKKPNLFIVGAQKSGTTSLHHYLSLHPDVFMSSVKEPAFFSKAKRIFELPNDQDEIGVKWYRERNYGFDEYMSLFSEVKNETYVGESSAEYLYYGVAEEIFKFNSEAKIVIILRNPVDRAYSAYTDLLNKVKDILTFEEELQNEVTKINDNYHYKWHFKQVGLYSKQIEEVYNYFPKKQVKVIVFEEFIQNSRKGMSELCDFLSIDSSLYQKCCFEAFNQSGIPINSQISRFINGRNILKDNFRRLLPNYFRKRLKRAVNAINIKKISLSPQLRKSLGLFFLEDIESVENILQINLEIWKEKNICD